MSLSWMAWTLPTALFFTAVVVALLVLTMLELRWPSGSRRGLLPMATTRGDRFFISLLCSAFVHIAWLATSDADVLWATLVSVLLSVGLLRWG
jgi:predicted small integral membrane protein